MALTVYPTDNYNSWISEADAEEYFDTRLYAEEWDSSHDQEAALLMAFRSLAELNIDLTDLDSSDADTAAAILAALQEAQCEQALHELKNDLQANTAQAVGLAGLISVKFQPQDHPARYSERALAILRPYLSVHTITRTR